jgi:hypothetical protein
MPRLDRIREHITTLPDLAVEIKKMNASGEVTVGISQFVKSYFENKEQNGIRQLRIIIL